VVSRGGNPRGEWQLGDGEFCPWDDLLLPPMYVLNRQKDYDFFSLIDLGESNGRIAGHHGVRARG
jgi:hypothetical protein